MKQLPLWVLNEKFASFYDFESKTAIEQIARVYGAMRTLIEEHNKMISDLNESMGEFEQNTGSKYDVFAMGLRQEFQDFIDIVNLQVEKLEQYMTNTLEDAINDLVSSGVLNIGLQYNLDEEELTLITE